MSHLIKQLKNSLKILKTHLIKQLKIKKKIHLIKKIKAAL